VPRRVFGIHERAAPDLSRWQGISERLIHPDGEGADRVVGTSPVLKGRIQIDWTEALIPGRRSRQNITYAVISTEPVATPCPKKLASRTRSPPRPRRMGERRTWGCWVWRLGESAWAAGHGERGQFGRRARDYA